MRSGIHLTKQQKEILIEITKNRTARKDHSIRSQMILLSAKGYSDLKVGRTLGISHFTVGKWCRRWEEQHSTLLELENQQDSKLLDYTRYIKSLLSDAPRSGAPPKFTEEQICQILATACEKPEASDLPLSHWSLSSLAEELVRRDIVTSISTSQLSNFLKSGEITAPQSRGMDTYPD